MTVNELIEELKKCPRDYVVVIPISELSSPYKLVDIEFLTSNSTRKEIGLIWTKRIT